MKMINLTGSTFGHLTVTSRADNDCAGRARWTCLCDCGNTTTVAGWQLRSGKTSSCGCQKFAGFRQNWTQHGHYGSRTYRRWQAMKRRCVDPAKASSYIDRGITVCQRWANSFEAFLEDMGECPSPELTLERVNNDIGYEPGNCIWDTRKAQANNRRTTVADVPAERLRSQS